MIQLQHCLLEYCSCQQSLRALIITALVKFLLVSGKELHWFSDALEIVGSGLFVLSYLPD